MRLLHTEELRWVETAEMALMPPYAILSHRWLTNASEEVSFQDLQRRQPEVSPSGGSHSNHAEHNIHPDVHRKAGFMKIKEACDRALDDGLKYIWVDTCCIDKTSSAELSEAINSMYEWYKNSAVCYVYLHDVDHDIDQDALISVLKKAEWFKRGWTLQELLAPDNVYFFAKDWSRIGSKATWASTLHEITHIREEILLGILCDPSIAERMSWAVGRKTQKIEDRAYSLMGLFGIHMPVIYGEGEKAFRRLQLEIMKSSDDQTIFAWLDSAEFPHPSRIRGSLASAPDFFLRDSHHPLINIDHSQFVRCLPQPGGWRNPFRKRPDLEHGYDIRNDGIHITLPMKRGVEPCSWLAVLKCKREGEEFPCGIHLRETRDPNAFLRTAPTKLQQLERKDLEGLVLKDIRMLVDHNVSSTIPRRQFITLRSKDPIWDRCGYYICPDPEGHDGQGDGRRALYSDTPIEFANNTQCSCIYYQDHRGELIVMLIGIKDYRPWIHLLTKTDLQRFIDTSPHRSRNGPDHLPPLWTSRLTSEPLNNAGEPCPIVTSPTSIQSNNHADHATVRPPFARSINHSDPQRRSTLTNPVLVRGTPTGCPVCAIIRHCGIDIRDVKGSRADLLTETVSGKQIEVGVRKGQVCTSDNSFELYVEYVITITTITTDF